VFLFEWRNLVFARVPSHFKRSLLPVTCRVSCGENVTQCGWTFLYVPPGLILKNSTWCSLCVERFVRISEQTAAFALYVINWLVFISVVESVYRAVRADSRIYSRLRFVFKRLTRKDNNFKVTYQERPFVAATLLSLCSCAAPTGSFPPTSIELAAAARRTLARTRQFFADWRCRRGQLNPNWRKWPHAQIRSGTCRYPKRNIIQCAINCQCVAFGENMTAILVLNILFLQNYS